MKIVLKFLLLLVVPVINSQAQRKPVFVMVHGAWGGNWSFKKTDSLLTRAGVHVYRPSLSGQGERVHLASKDIGLATHIKDVVNTILYEDLHNVVLMGHSYGGMVITGVADSIPDRIAKLIYLDAFAPNDGDNAFTTHGTAAPAQVSGQDFMIPVWVKAGQRPPKDVPQATKTFLEPVRWRNPAALKLPATYILTVDPGKTAAADSFYPSSKRARERGWKVVEMSADHNPQMSAPERLAILLLPEIK
ncbi:alpha/beta hydrolase [Pedobacter yulinensis]|uniref:Alpha/beta hydrolase n=1 Tax=Pedobacter yulinensis TaxID=2126353 RepID=A0A2T3HMI1_9SPHI|nr:alpha/beta hydrolase [Pedobacter yulinensis]PST83613.1 alpha/beta hydrolase [Pedobacter yulinensis]